MENDNSDQLYPSLEPSAQGEILRRDLLSQQTQQMGIGAQQAAMGMFGGAIGGLGSASAGIQSGRRQLPSIAPAGRLAEELAKIKQRDWNLGKSNVNRTINFHRVNDRVSIKDSEPIEIVSMEPLDELRITIAKWLYN